MQEYDYIIAGGGAAGLSLVYHLLQSPLRDKRILIIDKAVKNQNDRTWCFWEDKPGPFEAIVYKSWQQLSFYADDLERHASIAPFTYKMIRGLDFYQYIESFVASAENIDRIQGNVEAILNKGNLVNVQVNNLWYTARWCFSSILPKPINKASHNYLDQHFKGWFIQTEKPLFDPEKATLMDFRLPQEGETRFLYVLPFDQHRALVELAIFSDNLWTQENYNIAIQKYLEQHLNIYSADFAILEQEYGVIPMTDYPFQQREGNIIYIGTAGGHTKASTGYTFWRMQEFLQEMVASMIIHKEPRLSPARPFSRFQLYDSVLLHILEKDLLPADQLFATLFRENKMPDVLKFLNERTSFFEELKIMKALPVLTFAKVMLQEIGQQGRRNNLI